MNQYRPYYIRKLINNSLLFIFLLFSLSDLIDMHIRVIFNVDITSNYNIDGKTNNSPVKVKPAKKKNKPAISGSNINFTKPENSEKYLLAFTGVLLPIKLPATTIEKAANTLPSRAPPSV